MLNIVFPRKSINGHLLRFFYVRHNKRRNKATWNAKRYSLKGMVTQWISWVLCRSSLIDWVQLHWGTIYCIGLHIGNCIQNAIWLQCWMGEKIKCDTLQKVWPAKASPATGSSCQEGLYWGDKRLTLTDTFPFYYLKLNSGDGFLSIQNT